MFSSEYKFKFCSLIIIYYTMFHKSTDLFHSHNSTEGNSYCLKFAHTHNQNTHIHTREDINMGCDI